MMSEVVTGDAQSQADFTKPGPSITEDNPAAQVVEVPSQGPMSLANVSKPSQISPSEKKSAATQIVEAVLDEVDNNAELWHTSEGGCHISIHFPDGHVEHRSMKAKTTKQWLGGLYYSRTDMVANSSAIKSAINVLEGYAMKGPLYTTYIRVAEGNDAIYIDLGDDSWEAIKMSTQGWEIIKEPPVKFQRHRGLKPLPRPEQGGSIDDLRAILNIERDDLWLLVKGWLIGTLSPRGPYAILAIAGEQGSAKTWLERIRITPKF